MNRKSCMKIKTVILLMSAWLTVTTAIFNDVTECYTANGADYEGQQTQIESPVTHAANFTPCIRWDQSGISKFENLTENYCRNTNSSVFPWCFVRKGDGQVRAALCDIPTCKTPAYVGCFRPTVGPDSVSLMNGNETRLSDPKMKISRCLNFCRKRKYTYAGLGESHSCYCSKWSSQEEAERALSTENRLPDLDCKQERCAGDPIHACGGGNALAVYDTRAGACQAQYHNVDRGTIYSPRWPGRYQNNLTCSWKIYVPQKYFGDQYSIVFSFVYFDLEPVKDNLTFYTFKSFFDTVPTRVASLHGSDKQADLVISLKNVMIIYLQFDSDGQRAHYGFTAKFQVQTKNASSGNVENEMTTQTMQQTTQQTTQKDIQQATTAETAGPSTTRVATTQQQRPEESPTQSKQGSNGTYHATTISPSKAKTTSSENEANPAPKSIRSTDVIIIGIACALIVIVTIVVAMIVELKRRRKKLPEDHQPPADFKNPVTFNNGTSTVSIA